VDASQSTRIWCTSSRIQHKIPHTPVSVPVSVDTAIITLVCSVRDLGTYVDSDVSMRYVAKTVSSLFSVLRRIRIIRRSVTRPVLQSLVVSLVLTRLDYGSATLAGGLPRQLLDGLPSVMNAGARLVFSVRKYDHVTPLLRDLYWLPAQQRIEYRLAVLAFRCQHGTAPS